jgi:sporulation protein YlmC with PRC-barrel domain
MFIKQLLGKEVLDSSGNLAGKVTDMEIDLVTGAVKQIMIKSRLSGVKSVKPDDIITAGDKIIIRYRKENITKVTTFNFLGIKRRMFYNW